MRFPLHSRRDTCQVGVLLATDCTHRAAPALRSIVAEYDTQTTFPGPVTLSTEKTWIQGQKSRSEISGPSGLSLLITNDEGRFYLSPGSRQARRLPAPSQPSNPLSEIETIKQHGKKVGAERVGPYRTRI